MGRKSIGNGAAIAKNLMERQATIFTALLAIVVIILLIFFLALYLFPGRVSVEINELKEDIATLQTEATLGSERADEKYEELMETTLTQQASFTATRQALINEIDQISQTTKSIAASATSISIDATAMANDLNLLAATATARAPVTVSIREGESVDLFGHELSIILDGYSSAIFSGITFTIQGSDAIPQTFEDVVQGETVFYQGKSRYAVLINNVSEKEDTLIVEFVILIG